MKPTRNTNQKLIIAETLKRMDHPTATEVFEAVRNDHPTISRATVFRVLSGFAESGTAVKLCLKDSPARFDFRINPHAHAHCIECGRVFDVEDKAFEGILERKKLDGFEIFASSIEFTGVCKDCKEKFESKIELN